MNFLENERARASLRAPGIIRVLDAYREQGCEVILGNPDDLLTQLAKGGRVLRISASLSLTDILVFQWVADLAPWRRVLVIGNAFGFSTFLLASLCPECSVDAIDAEIEGSENRFGSELTRKIATNNFPRVQLTGGFSPQDLPQATRFDAYDFILVDGLHTNDQLVADYQGIRDMMAQTCIVYCHDVGIAKMNAGWSYIRTELLQDGDEAFDLHFTSFGSTMVVRGASQLSDFMRICCRPIESSFYYFGAKGIGIRTACRMLFRTFRHSSPLGDSHSYLTKRH
jgi:predicted O-methyltransferase YrrM